MKAYRPHSGWNRQKSSAFLAPSLPFRKQRMLLGLIGLLPVLGGTAFAENYPLESIDFIANNRQTNIILHTGSIVPVQKVMISDNKLMLDIDQIDATETIRTNFTGAANISHVILQPLNEHKIRLIIRGENLGNPSLAFYNASNGAYNTPNGEAAAPEAASIPFKSSETGAEGLQEAAPIVETTKNALLAENEAPITEPIKIQEPLKTEAEPILASHLKLMPELNKPAPLSTSKMPSKKSADWMDKFMDTPWSGYLPYAVLAFLILGLGLFIRNRFLKITRPDLQLEDLLMTNQDNSQISGKTNGKRSSFKEMAEAYRSNRSEESDVDTELPVERNNARKADNKDVIGLHSLNNNDVDADEPIIKARPAAPMAQPLASATPPAAPAPGVSLEQLLAAMQKAQAVTEKPRRGINPYVPPQVNPATVSKVGKAAGNKSRVTKPAQGETAVGGIDWPSTALTAPVNRAVAAKKSAPVSTPTATDVSKTQATTKNASKSLLGNSQQGPLPGNPEVLNFLRNVADLMEKDGKTDIAQNIHKNLNSQNIGLTR
jgi:hypothetical protein